MKPGDIVWHLDEIEEIPRLYSGAFLYAKHGYIVLEGDYIIPENQIYYLDELEAREAIVELLASDYKYFSDMEGKTFQAWFDATKELCTLREKVPPP